MAQAAFSFQLTGPFPVGDMEQQAFRGGGQVVAPADLDGDGDVDLAVVGQSHLLPTVLLGDGAGHFSPGPVPVGTTGFGEPTAVVAADLDGDGDQDVAYAESYLGATVLLNDGTGLLHFKGSFAGGKTAVSLAAADLDGDGDVDLALGYLGGMATLLNDGSGGGFVEHDVALGGALPADLAAGDFDGDGDVDVAAANLAAEDDGSGDDVLVLDNDGAGVFTVSQRVDVQGLGGISIVAAQLSSDRAVDLAVASYRDADTHSPEGDPALTILRNDGSGGFAIGPHRRFNALRSVAAADFDGNGRDDLVVIQPEVGAIFVEHVRPRDSAITDAYLSYVDFVDKLGVETATIDAGGKPDIIIASETDSLYTALNTTGPPATTIVAGPAEGATVDDPTPAFAFATNEPGTRFQCALDDAAYTPCANPATLDALTDGPHTLTVRAVDGDDHHDPTPASRTFTVVSPDTNTLTVHTTAAGATPDTTEGAVTSDTGGISCERSGAGQDDQGTCSAAIANGGQVTLTATPSGNASAQLSGDGCSEGPGAPGEVVTCTVTMDQARTVTATFAVLKETLTVTTRGAGTSPLTALGTVTTSPAGIDCVRNALGDSQGACGADFLKTTVVTVKAQPTNTETSATLSGACSAGPGEPGLAVTCTVTMDQAEAVTATFTAPPTAPDASVAPAALRFPTTATGHRSQSRAVTLSNTGTGPLTGIAPTASPGFAVTGGTCGETLAAGESCTIEVAEAPTAAGSQDGTLTIADDDPDGPQTVTLSGDACEAVCFEGRLVTGPRRRRATFTVAVEQDPDGATRVGRTLRAVRVTIDWGDGTSTTGTAVVTARGEISVQGDHYYARRGTYDVTVTIIDGRSTANHNQGDTAPQVVRSQITIR